MSERQTEKKRRNSEVLTGNPNGVSLDQRSKPRNKASWVAKTGILSAIAIILMYLEFPIPFMPFFLKFDFAEVVALLGAFAMGPWTGLLIELIKNISHLPFSSTAFTGELANFLICGSFVWVAGMVYAVRKTKKSALIGMIAGTLVMTLMGVLVNYFINIPFYITAMGLKMDTIVGMANKAGNTLVSDLKTLIIFVFVPFNIFKGFVVSVITLLIYKKVRPLLRDV